MRRSVDVLKSEFDAGNAEFAGARLRFFEGNRATTRGSFPTGAVLATINCPAPLFNPCTWNDAQKKLTAVKASGALQDISADGAGNVGCFAFDDNGVFRGDGTVGLAGSGADCIVDRVDVSVGAPFVVQSLAETDTVAD